MDSTYVKCYQYAQSKNRIMVGWIFSPEKYTDVGGLLRKKKIDARTYDLCNLSW